MMTARKQSGLIVRLPPVRGRLTANAPMEGLTWFRIGGPAEVLFVPADTADLADFLAARPAGVPVTVVGFGSNLLVRDGGIPGIVIRLGRGFAGIAIDGAVVTAGGAAMDANVANAARDARVAGLEFLCGIPGTIGGSLRMNAGAYEREMKDVVVAATTVDLAGTVRRHTLDELGYTYRACALPDDRIFVEGVFAGMPGERDAIARRMTSIATVRRESQPIQSRTGGSTFKNPPGHRAWELIDAAGCRGLTMGGAKVSELHCNFLINTGAATAADLEGLGEAVRRRVFDYSGIMLEWEIRRIGLPHGAEGAP